MSYTKLFYELRDLKQKSIAIDVWRKQNKQNTKRIDKYDPKIFDKGTEWFNSGLSFDDAPEELKNNTNFVNGFKKGIRLAEINNSIYNDGRSFFYTGRPLDQASEILKNNPYFISGYNDALNLVNDLDELNNSQKR